jgi:glucose dehydrogenase
MKTLLTVTSIFAIIIGLFAIIGSVPAEGYEGDSYGMIGGIMFTVQGILPLIYINTRK